MMTSILLLAALLASTPSAWIQVDAANGVKDDYYPLPRNAADGSFRFRVSRNADNTIGVEAFVRDDRIVVDDCRPGEISCPTWKDDCLEVFFDGDDDRNPNTRGPDWNDHPTPCNAGGEYAIAANGATQSDYASAKKCFGKSWGGVAEPWTEAGARVGTHYRLWFSWDCLNRPAPKPDEPVTLGMTICIHDDDDGGACDKALYWKGNPKYPFADESAFGRLDLPPAGGRTLTYVQWNIGHFAMGKGPRTKVRPEQSAARSAEYRAFIRDLKADVIGISEFEDHFDTAKTPSRTAVFERYPNLVAGPANSYQWNALMTREWAFKTNRVHNYKSRFQHVYWLETVCEIDGRDVHFVQTHLDWNTTSECAAHRTRQLRELADAFRDVPYVVISGDFNVYANEEYDVFREAGFSLANGGAFGLFRTMGEKPDPVNPQVLDNIVAKGFALESAEILDPDMRLSDHRVLKARLRLLP